MALAKDRLYTTEDIYALPDGQRAELIDGSMYLMAHPKRIHQKFVHFLDVTIGNYIREKGGDCEVYPAPFAVFLSKDDRNYVEPDISVVCDREKLTEDGCSGVPDWIIEAVSPGSRRIDYYMKLFKYRTAGVREYWIVDPDKERVTVYNFDEETVMEQTLSECVKSGIYDDLEIDFCSMQL